MKKFLISVLMLACLAFTCVFAACANNSEQQNPPPAQIPQATYWGTLSGTVYENGTGLKGVKVTSGSQTAETDENGAYTIKVYSDGATVSFEKQGCITQKKTFKSSSFYVEEINYDFIMYISTKVGGTVVNAEGEPLSGAQVEIGIQKTVTDAQGKFEFESVIGTTMIVIVSYDGKTVRKPVYNEQMRTGNVSVNIKVK